MWGEQSSRSGGNGRRSRDDDGSDRNNYNVNDNNIWENCDNVDCGGVGRRGSGNCNGNIEGADSGMRRGGKGLIPIPVFSANLPASLLPYFLSKFMPASSLPMTAKAG